MSTPGPSKLNNCKGLEDFIPLIRYLYTSDGSRRAIHVHVSFERDSSHGRLCDALVFTRLGECDVVNLEIAFSSTSVMSSFQIVVKLSGSVETQRDAVMLPDVSEIEDPFSSSAAADMLSLSDCGQYALRRLFCEDWAT